MTRIIESDDNGNLILPRDLLGQPKPHAKYQVDAEGNTLVLRPVPDVEQYWTETTPEERAEAFLKWAESPKPKAPVLPDEALRRESMYD